MSNKTYNATTVARSAKPRSKRLREAGYSAVTIIGNASDGGSGASHSHANKDVLDALSLDTERYLSATLYDKDTELSTTAKIKAGYADQADEARHALNADDADKWDGRQFADYLDQSVRKGDKVSFEQVATPAVTTPDFVPGGFAGAGAGLVTYANGQTGVEVDHIIARRTVSVNEVVINQAAHVGGRTLYSAANMECTRVVNGGTYYRCFFDTKNGQRANLWRVGDQAYCQRYSPDGTQMLSYYWRLVTSVGEDWINISVSDCDGAGVPAEGDNIIQVGSRTDPKRQAMLEIDQTNGGRVVQYAGINSFNFVNRNEVAFGVNDQGKPFFYAYGDLFVGDRDLSDPDATYITFQTPQGDTRRRMVVSADLRIGRGSSGLTNLSEWAEKQQQIDTAEQMARDVSFLKDGFKDFTTDIAGGLVLSSFMGVRNDEGDVTAGMAGRNFIDNKPFVLNDETCPMIFAGNTGNTTNANSAKTRIYPNGLLYTDRLKANGGDIGVFNIGYELDPEGNPTPASGLFSKRINGGSASIPKYDYARFFSSSLRFESEVWNSVVAMGTNVLSATALMYANILIDNGFSPNLPVAGIRINMSGSDPGNVGRHALYIDRGTIAGLRPNIYYSTGLSNETLSKMHHTVVINNDRDKTIYLPGNPENGQEYRFFKQNNHWITIHGNGIIIRNLGYTDGPAQKYDPKWYGYVIMTYNKNINKWMLVDIKR